MSTEKMSNDEVSYKDMSDEDFDNKLRDLKKNGTQFNANEFEPILLKMLIVDKIISEDESRLLEAAFRAENMRAPKFQEYIKKVNAHFNVTTNEWISLDLDELDKFTDKCDRDLSEFEAGMAVNNFAKKILPFNPHTCKNEIRQICLEYLSK
ncbi:hypothetical protein OAG24_00575 [bacterium]|nr:hypothetical protein [bacterium]